jgi:predicted glycoside hydrolase/deacetylase ChbG (UPF0249 family)
MNDTPRTIRLCCRADDAASSRSANRAIRETIQKGLCRNVSVLAIGHELKDAYEALGSLKGVCIGLHAAVNCEWTTPRWGPVLPREKVPTLLDDDGALLSRVWTLHERGITAEEMFAEVKAQLELLRKTGFDVTYVDEHMGFARTLGFAEAMEDFARKEGLFACDYSPKISRLPKAPREGRTAPQVVADSLACAGPGTYMLVNHPTYDDAEIAAVAHDGREAGDIGPDRNQQRLAFMAPEVMAAAKRLGVVPTRFLDV